KADIIYVTEDALLTAGSVGVRIYAPIVQAGKDDGGGLIVLATQNTFDVLITGDAGARTEEVLADRNSLPDIELLIAGQHGSDRATGEVLLSEVTPESVLISSGAGGYPAMELLERLAERGVDVYRTDVLGKIEFKAE
ncbi:MAG: DNA internalization-related competence protein ComEC/Rec2, partial [Oscillospiraceae bacterium]|nr:DNA internalization-related competence protein ComEC/Rec2 [Oscillospiraceae bacterium]